VIDVARNRDPVEAITAQEVLDGIPASAVLLDRRGRIVAVNRSWVEFCIKNGGDVAAVGPSVDYVLACAGANPTSSAREVVDGITGVLQRTINRFDFEYPCHAPETERWFRMTVTPVPHGAMVIHHDITGEYARVSRWLASTSVVILELDPSGNAVYVNSAWASRARLPVRRLLGSHWAEHLDPDQLDTLLDAVHHVAQTGRDLTVDVRLPDHDRSVWMRLTVSAYFDDHSTLRRLTVFGIDVTEQHDGAGAATATAPEAPSTSG
jgi:PAS domain S-box-containing protein